MPAIYSLLIWRRAAALCRIRPAIISAQYFNLQDEVSGCPAVRRQPCKRTSKPQLFFVFFLTPSSRQLDFSSFLYTPAKKERNLHILSLIHSPHLVKQQQERQCLQSPHLHDLSTFIGSERRLNPRWKICKGADAHAAGASLWSAAMKVKGGERKA